ESIFSMPLLLGLLAAPAFPAPSVAVQIRLCVPSPLTTRFALAGDVLIPLATMIGEPELSVHEIEVTFDGSVAVTTTVTGVVVNAPVDPGGGGIARVTTGGGTSCTVIVTVATFDGGLSGVELSPIQRPSSAV